jgi:hypothetical protein
MAVCAVSMAQCGSCSTKKMTADEKFLQEAHLMAMKAEGKTPCCKSSFAKPVVKGGQGCCKAPGAKDKTCAMDGKGKAAKAKPAKRA